jgi:GNAT superfamily N-acetyltransferase
MMNNISIVPYTPEDNEAAIALEMSCPQGSRIKLRFVRTSFHRRSEVYDKSIIMCAKCDGRVVGIGAGAVKNVGYRGDTIRVFYGYDLRIHPDYRKFGLARKLSEDLIDYFPDRIDSYYTYVAGQNDRALKFVKRGMAAQVMISLTYVIIPIYKRYHPVDRYENVSMDEIHDLYQINNPEIEFLTSFNPGQLIAHVNSVKLTGDVAGTSIWTNENILAEQVVGLPNRLKIIGLLQRMLLPVVRLPRLPGINETLKSWILFDFFASDDRSLRSLLGIVNNLALDSGKDFLYILLQNDDPILAMIQRTKLRMFTIPYVFFAKGNKYPRENDLIYIDIRDL